MADCAFESCTFCADIAEAMRPEARLFPDDAFREASLVERTLHCAVRAEAGTLHADAINVVSTSDARTKSGFFQQICFGTQNTTIYPIPDHTLQAVSPKHVVRISGKIL